VKLKGAVDPAIDSGNFATTHWSVVLSCASGEDKNGDAEAALSQLCRTYWRPIFTFVCRRGYSVSDAQDLTQDFFLMVLSGNLLHYADPTRGRFRSLLLKSLQNFLIDAKEKTRARKRGGHIDFVSWDDWMAEAPSQLSVPARVVEGWPAERLYDLRWAATIAEEALRRLSEECESRGRRRVFDMLSGCLTAERSDVSYAELAASLGVSVAAVKRLVHQLRARYRALLRGEVAKTVEKASDIEDEIRYLCATLVVAEEQAA
jgi:RNA polymerase sigma factor (sigma-70 family)